MDISAATGNNVDESSDTEPNSYVSNHTIIIMS